MRCHDKLESRRLQRDVVPQATPRFFALDPSDPIPDPLPLPFPLFVKPVSAHLSQLAFPVRDRRELEEALAAARAQLDRVAAFDEELEGRSFHLMLVEELLEGRLVTFEGFMHAGRMTPIGVTDSILHPNGISFVRFDYPSALPSHLSDRLGEIAEVLMPALGFDDSLFNIEFFVHADGTAKIVEVNGRMASQFAPLIRAVHGMSSYRIQLELVTGGKPHLPKPRTDMVASSFVLRRYMVGRHRRVGPGPGPRRGTVPWEPGRAARPAGTAPVGQRRRLRQPSLGGGGDVRPGPRHPPPRLGGCTAPPDLRPPGGRACQASLHRSLIRHTLSR